MHPEARHYLIENQEYIVRLRDPPQSFQIAVHRWNHTHVACHRFNYHRRNLPGVLIQDCLHRGKIVEWHNQRVFYRTVGNPRTVR